MKQHKRFKDKNIREPLPGFRDIVGKEVRVKNYVANKISEVFQKRGYDEILLPLVERASSFSEQVVGSSPWPEWDKRSVFYLHTQDYKDSYQDLPAQTPSLLIPEGTISVSRWLARILKESEKQKELFPIKLFYKTPCFRNELLSKLSATKGREFHQVGVEVLGTSSLLADIEVLFLICAGFEAMGIPKRSITVRIGSIEIFNRLCTESGFEEQTRIDLKNSLDIIAESRAGKGVDRLKPELAKVANIIKQKHLPNRLNKKWEIVCNTSSLLLNDQIKNNLDYPQFVNNLNTVAVVVRNMGVKCVIDLSVARSHEYYTGIVYEVDLKLGNNLFVEVAGGGRYNKLISKFLAGKEYQIPAVGFAYGLERITEFFGLMRKRDNVPSSVKFWLSENSVDSLLYSKVGTPTQIMKLFESAEKLIEQDQRVSVYVGDGDKTKAKRYAKKLGAEFVSQ